MILLTIIQKLYTKQTTCQQQTEMHDIFLEPFENEKCKNISLQFNISTLLTNPTWYMYKSTETKTVNSNMAFQAKYLSNITNIQSWAIKARVGPKSVDPLLIKLVPFPLF